MMQSLLQKRRLLIACLLLAAWLMPQAQAQESSNLTLKIPIQKVRRHYYSPHEDGTGVNCGVRLYGVWEVFKNYTNLLAYKDWSRALVGVRTPSTPKLVVDGDRKYFEVYCYFNGTSSPRNDVPCDHQIGGGLPEWEITLTRTPPSARFSATLIPTVPGEVRFQTFSSDPENPEHGSFQHAWNFGDTNTATGDAPVHLYTRPGRYNVRLTATTPDGLSGSAVQSLTIPSPRPLVSMRLLSKHSRNRIEPTEEFRVQLTVQTTSDGVGALTNLAFNGPALIAPGIFTVVSAPPATNLGSMLAGQRRDFEWTLRATGMGSFNIASSSVTGRDEAGQNVFGASTSQRGEVTALLVDLTQRPSRVILGEDNNADGVINEDDSRVQVIVGITNITETDVTQVRTDNLLEPIQLRSRLAGPTIALLPAGNHSGDFGTIRPGLANAVIRTNTYQATNYVLASASIQVRGEWDSLVLQTTTETEVKVQNPGVTLRMHALDAPAFTLESIEAFSIHAPLVPVTTKSVLDAQRKVLGGLVGDGVTPLLFILEADARSLAVTDELELRLVARVKSGGELKDTGLQDRFRVLKDGAWQASDLVKMTRTDPKAYVYLTPIQADDLKITPGSGALNATLALEYPDSKSELTEFEFGIRKPPVALVHGFNSDGTGWGEEFLKVLKTSRPDDESSQLAFVQVITYGLRKQTNLSLPDQSEGVMVNTSWSMEALAPLLDAELARQMSPLKQAWAWTRYDVVGHSQGGVLARMLCTQNRNDWLDQPFRNEKNHFRGRFHRVITLGAPHNGTRLIPYLRTLVSSEADADSVTREDTLPRRVAGMLMLNGAAQDKFDPWGRQVFNINRESDSGPWFPDSNARMHVMRTTVQGGLAPGVNKEGTWAELALGMNIRPFPEAPANNPAEMEWKANVLNKLGNNLDESWYGPDVPRFQTPGQLIFPRGSDGVVDYESMGGATLGVLVAANVYSVPSDHAISHSGGSAAKTLGGHEGGQNDSTLVAQHLLDALDQEGSFWDLGFGAFKLPRRLPEVIRTGIEIVAEYWKTKNQSLLTNDLAALDLSIDAGSPGLHAQGAGPRNFTLRFVPSAGRPVGTNTVHWFAEVFGTNGVSTEGLTLVPDPGDSKRAVVTVAPGVLGDVVVYAISSTPDGRVAYSQPRRIASFEPASRPVAMRVLPQGSALPVGASIRIEAFVQYEDGQWMQRHVERDEIRVTSFSPQIVNVEHPLQWRCASSGETGVEVAWQGMTNLATVTVFGSRDGVLPIPEPMVWLKADAGVQLSPTNVISWTDQSRNGFVFAARNEAARPTWVADAGNGTPALRFDSASRDQLTGNLGTTLTNATIFTLMRLSPQSGTRTVYAFGTRNSSGLMMTLSRRSGDHAYYYDGAFEWDSPGTWTETNLVVVSQTYGGSGPDHHRLDFNGRTVIDSRTTTGRAISAVATNVVLGNYVSGANNISGDWVEWIVYDRALEEAERTQVEDYLRHRAGLPPFREETEVSLAPAGFGLGAPDRQIATWSYDSTKGTSHAEGGAAPSVVLLDQAFAGEEVRTQLAATGGHGALGVVFGYQNRGNFFLLDWRALSETNSLGKVAPAGLRLIQFHTPPELEAPRFDDFFGSTNLSSTTILMSHPLLWTPGRVYPVALRPSAQGLTIEVFDGETPILAWQLPDWTGPVGWFGHYSQGVEAAEFGPASILEAPNEEPISVSFTRGAGTGEWILQWSGGRGSYVVERTTNLGSGAWQPVGVAENSTSRTIVADGAGGFFRVRQDRAE